MLEKERYIDLHRELHESPRRFTGLSLREWIEEIDQLMITHDCKNILDYGCGKARFWPAHWLEKIQGYDPAVENFSEEPRPADMVVCTDVMEHIPESSVDDILKHINSLSNKWIFFVIDSIYFFSIEFNTYFPFLRNVGRTSDNNSSVKSFARDLLERLSKTNNPDSFIIFRFG